MLPKGSAVDGDDVIHHQCVLAAAIGATLAKIRDDAFSLSRSEILVSKPTQEMPDKGTLRVPDGIALVTPTRRPVRSWGRIIDKDIANRDSMLGEVLAKERKAFACGKVEPLARDPHRNAMDNMDVAPKSDLLGGSNPGHRLAERLVDVERFLAESLILQPGELGPIPVFAKTEYRGQVVLDKLADLHSRLA